MMNSETTMFESQSAMAGTSLLFCAAKSRGMSCDLLAANSASAQISVQARNAPNTEISTPIETGDRNDRPARCGEVGPDGSSEARNRNAGGCGPQQRYRKAQ